ncbi:sigma factor-like helix-turn-helix DNA-binding protein [Pyruvatibacter mobilis]|uniref:sigma factor-like helix-turn-helix DNA-binding protein n=1 Tax=Pyruvatibacter mobilis TaxID=1712261 RepID=UPI003BAB396A
MTAPAKIPVCAERLAALATLTPTEREILRARVAHEGPVEDVAAAIGRKPKRVHEHLLAARQKLFFRDSLSMVLWLVVTRVDLGDGLSVHGETPADLAGDRAADGNATGEGTGDRRAGL